MVIITENDVSQWEDQTGVLYHFPKRYEKYLKPGTSAIYYKGSIKLKHFSDKRLSNDPHYFGTAIIGHVYPDESSSKGDLFATIESFKSFTSPVLAKENNSYLEEIPESRKANYWRDGVRQVSQVVFDRILNKAGGSITPIEDRYTDLNDLEVSLESGTEGKQTKRYITVYERDSKLRNAAISIHGYDCVVCGFNFEEAYGDYAKGFIHIHHIVPVSEFGDSKIVNPQTDLVPVCANCHSIIHRKRNNTLSIQEMKRLLKT